MIHICCALCSLALSDIPVDVSRAIAAFAEKMDAGGSYSGTQMVKTAKEVTNSVFSASCKPAQAEYVYKSHFAGSAARNVYGRNPNYDFSLFKPKDSPVFTISDLTVAENRKRWFGKGSLCYPNFHCSGERLDALLLENKVGRDIEWRESAEEFTAEWRDKITRSKIIFNKKALRQGPSKIVEVALDGESSTEFDFPVEKLLATGWPYAGYKVTIKSGGKVVYELVEDIQSFAEPWPSEQSRLPYYGFPEPSSGKARNWASNWWIIGILLATAAVAGRGLSIWRRRRPTRA